MCGQSSSRVLPSLTTWNCMKAKAVTVIGGKPCKINMSSRFCWLAERFRYKLLREHRQNSGFSFVPYPMKNISYFDFASHALENRMLDHTLGVYMILVSSLRYTEARHYEDFWQLSLNIPDVATLHLMETLLCCW